MKGKDRRGGVARARQPPGLANVARRRDASSASDLKCGSFCSRSCPAVSSGTPSGARSSRTRHAPSHTCASAVRGITIAKARCTRREHSSKQRLGRARIALLHQVARQSEQHRFERWVNAGQDTLEVRDCCSEQRFGAPVTLGAQHASETALNRTDPPMVVAVDAAKHRERLSEQSLCFIEPASVGQQHRQIVHDRGDVGMLSPEQAAIQIERGSIQPLGLVVLSPIAQHEREVVGDRRGVGMNLTEPPQVEVEDLSIEPLRFGQFPRSRSRIARLFIAVAVSRWSGPSSVKRISSVRRAMGIASLL